MTKPLPDNYFKSISRDDMLDYHRKEQMDELMKANKEMMRAVKVHRLVTQKCMSVSLMDVQFQDMPNLPKYEVGGLARLKTDSSSLSTERGKLGND